VAENFLNEYGDKFSPLIQMVISKITRLILLGLIVAIIAPFVIIFLINVPQVGVPLIQRPISILIYLAIIILVNIFLVKPLSVTLNKYIKHTCDVFKEERNK